MRQPCVGEDCPYCCMHAQRVTQVLHPATNKQRQHQGCTNRGRNAGCCFIQQGGEEGQIWVLTLSRSSFKAPATHLTTEQLPFNPALRAPAQCRALTFVRAHSWAKASEKLSVAVSAGVKARPAMATSTRCTCTRNKRQQLTNTCHITPGLHCRLLQHCRGPCVLPPKVHSIWTLAPANPLPFCAITHTNPHL